jgi:hypothetical protein
MTQADVLLNRYLRLAARKASPERDAEADLALADYLISVANGPDRYTGEGSGLLPMRLPSTRPRRVTGQVQAKGGRRDATPTGRENNPSGGTQ